MFDIVTDIPQPKDLGIMFKDIITDGHVERVKALALLESDHKQFIKDELKQSIYLKSRIEKGKQPPNLIYVDTNKINYELPINLDYPNDIKRDEIPINLVVIFKKQISGFSVVRQPHPVDTVWISPK